MQLANTPPLQSTTSGLHPVSIHQTSPLVRGSKHPITAYYSIYRPRKDERLSRPAWLVTYRNKVSPPGVEHVTHPSTNRARCRVTSLIRPTLLPLRHAVTQSSKLRCCVLEWRVSLSECSTNSVQLLTTVCRAKRHGTWQNAASRSPNIARRQRLISSTYHWLSLPRHWRSMCCCWGGILCSWSYSQKHATKPFLTSSKNVSFLTLICIHKYIHT